MRVSIRSFAKINLGLRVGALRADGFHELRTVYQTIALHDIIRVSVGRGSGIEIRCDDPRVPRGSSNTCYRIVERAMQALKARGRVVIEIEKQLPVQGGLGGASGNAVAAVLALERGLKKEISGAERLRIAAEVGSDLPLFLIGGTVLGAGRGEEVYPLPDLPVMPCVMATPEIAVSTPKAFADWDDFVESLRNGHSETASAGQDPAVGRRHRHFRGKQVARLAGLRQNPDKPAALRMTKFLNEARLTDESKLTAPTLSDRMLVFSREISAWLSFRSGVSARGGGRAENQLLDLVRTGIENDFEKVVFPKHPELREIKSVLQRAGARYASLSGSGSAVYGLFESRKKAAAAANNLIRGGIPAIVTSTLTRRQYWKRLQISD